MFVNFSYNFFNNRSLSFSCFTSLTGIRHNIFFSLSISISLFFFKLSFSSSFTYSPTFLKQMRTSVFESRVVLWENHRKPIRNIYRISLLSIITLRYYLYHCTQSVLFSFVMFIVWSFLPFFYTPHIFLLHLQLLFSHTCITEHKKREHVGPLNLWPN